MILSFIARASRIFLVVIAVLITMGGLFDWADKRGRIAKHKKLLSQIERQADELLQLGFSEQDEAVQFLRQRAKRQYNKVVSIKKERFAQVKKNKNKKIMQISEQNIQDLIALNKKMIQSYAADIRDYHKLGIQEGAPIVMFSRDKMIRLAMSLHELKKKLHELSDHALIKKQLKPRLARMKQVNEQSAQYYQYMLRRYQKENSSLVNEQAEFAKKQLTSKLHALNELDQVF